MYKKIKNPKTGRLINANSSTGKKILKNYLRQIGGDTAIAKYGVLKINPRKKFLDSGVNKTSNYLNKRDKDFKNRDFRLDAIEKEENYIIKLRNEIEKLKKLGIKAPEFQTPEFLEYKKKIIYQMIK